MTKPITPVAKTEPHIHAYGTGTPDNYHWLKDRAHGTAKRPEIIEYLNAENEYAKKLQFDPNAALSETLYKEFLGKLEENDQQAPYFKDGYWYYTRTVEGQQYPIYCRRFQTMDAPEEEYLNNNLIKDVEYLQVGATSVSQSGKLLAYSLDTAGDEIFKIYIKNLETGELLPEVIENCSADVVWDNEDKALYYMSTDSLMRADKLYKHVLGSDIASDAMYVFLVCEFMRFSSVALKTGFTTMKTKCTLLIRTKLTLVVSLFSP
jgi:oligopeptidase B